jgi:hypothetical protein
MTNWYRYLEIAPFVELFVSWDSDKRGAGVYANTDDGALEVGIGALHLIANRMKSRDKKDGAFPGHDDNSDAGGVQDTGRDHANSNGPHPYANCG